jgi:hypothetical protein
MWENIFFSVLPENIPPTYLLRNQSIIFWFWDGFFKFPEAAIPTQVHYVSFTLEGTWRVHAGLPSHINVPFSLKLF